MNIGEGGVKREKRKRNLQSLLTIGNKLRVDGGRWAGDGQMGDGCQEGT